MPEPLRADAPEELRVLGVRARPAAFQVMDAQLVQPPRDFQLVVDRERQALALRTVPQCRVVQEHVLRPPCGDNKSGAASRAFERPRRACWGPAVRQPSAGTPPLKKSRMLMLVINRLRQRTLIAVILTPGRDASIPRTPPPVTRGPAPPHRPPPWREARDLAPQPGRRASRGWQPRSAEPGAYRSRSRRRACRDPRRARAAGP